MMVYTLTMPMFRNQFHPTAWEKIGHTCFVLFALRNMFCLPGGTTDTDYVALITWTIIKKKLCEYVAMWPCSELFWLVAWLTGLWCVVQRVKEEPTTRRVTRGRHKKRMSSVAVEEVCNHHPLTTPVEGLRSSLFYVSENENWLWDYWKRSRGSGTAPRQGKMVHTDTIL